MTAVAAASAERLRGGFYTPPGLVELCLRRAAGLLGDATAIDVLEPSAGDGAFVRGLANSACGLGERVREVLAIEMEDEEAAKTELSLRAAGISGRVLRGSALHWAADTGERFELVVGNPPFVRYQLVPPADRAAIERLGERLGLTFRGVANLWIPLLLGALARLRPGGALAVVLPAECFTGLAAGTVREWLAREVEELTVDLVPRGSFPGVVQEVAVLSGRRRPSGAGPHGHEMRIVEHACGGGCTAWSYRPAATDRGWMGSLLRPRHREALEAARSLATVTSLGRVARMSASAITGANDFFCIDDRTLAAHELTPWARPLLARPRHAPGLVLEAADHAAARRRGARAWLLDFDADAPDPQDCPGARAYLERGLREGAAERYKCRSREPWYRVPSLRCEPLLLAKRSHRYPRLLVNRAQLHTTDASHRGDVLPGQAISARDLAACFHCSLTLLTVELEGRSFGGGVLELVPSELSRLAVVRGVGLGERLEELDAIARGRPPEELVRATDSLLVSAGLLPRELVDQVCDARVALMARRLTTSRPGP